MNVNLVKKSNEWIVTHVVTRTIVHDKFDSIEKASILMEALGVKDEDIDYALCEMLAYNHNRAIFTDEGYSHSEEF